MTTVTPTRQINGDRLHQTLMTLAQIGGLSEGGVKRLAFTDADLQARAWVQQQMVAAGMTTQVDAAGNLIGTYAGQEALPSLVTGSHIDTVPTGGRYDGALGVIAGIEVVRSLHEQGMRLRHPLEVIAFADEEGSMIGSRAIAGTVAPELGDYTTAIGLPLREALPRLGGDWSALESARRSSQNLAAYVELHVEQGGILESRNRQIGVVQGVVGQQRYTLTAIGSPNHAGTTLMTMRQDALLAMSKVVQAVHEIACRTPGDPVATVGAMQIWPNTHNIVPGRVEASLDIRAMSAAVMTDIVAALQQELEFIAQATDTELTLTPLLTVAPTPASPAIQTAIAQVCDELGFSHYSLPSRAIHDAQELGRITDMGMIFVPSQGGVSHAEVEYTSPEQCYQGAIVLLETLLKLDQAK